jgi:hypothetical protein
MGLLVCTLTSSQGLAWLSRRAVGMATVVAVAVCQVSQSEVSIRIAFGGGEAAVIADREGSAKGEYGQRRSRPAE